MSEHNDYLTYSRACRAANVDPIDFESSMLELMSENGRAYFDDGGSLAQQNAYYTWLIGQLPE